MKVENVSFDFQLEKGRNFITNQSLICWIYKFIYIFS